MKPEVEAAVRAYLERFLKILGESAQLELKEEGGMVMIDLKGMEILSGQEQEALRALDYLLELALKRRLHEGVRVQLDVNSYRLRRKEELRLMALKLGEEARAERKRIRLNPMEPWERKAIHEALAGFAGVRTYSEGRGAERRVVIEPRLH
ncbi:MAG: protein jag [Candidatus Acetothermia bacterium]|jgi:spoIIIJ-associated protein|nr:protein jag [Candidatus Acetothermia bacterium]MDH7505283.1 R3H domain-containing nucleic acid-binding protein [Candidatus Acetothermia bacterium]